MTLTYGELFAGYGGAGLAIEAFFPGAKPLWFSEIEPAAIAVLAHHWPDVPNLGDISEIDFAKVERPDILHSSFPCTDVSSAGRQKGLDGTRSGLWAHTVRAIDQLRPSLVTIENVRGLLSTRTGGGNAADSDMESGSPTLGDATDRSAQRAAGTVLGDLADLGYDAVWTTVAASDVGAAHQRKRVFILAYPAESHGIGRGQGEGQSVSVQTSFTPTLYGDGALLPSPVAQPSGNSPEAHLRKKPGRTRVTDLAIIAENNLFESGGLLPTVVATERKGPTSPLKRGRTQGDQRLSDAVLLPTVRASEADQTMGAPGAVRHVEAGNGGLTETIGTYFPTPRTTDANGGGRYSSDGHQSTLPGTARELEQSWGKYESAIRRAERALDRSAPSPTESNRNGRPRLSAVFAEWLMMLPAGHVTALAHVEYRKQTKNGFVVAVGLSRREQLMMLGNGIVPPQMFYALSILYPLIGVRA